MGVIILAVVAVPVGLVIVAVSYLMFDHVRERRRANRRHIIVKVGRIPMSQMSDKFKRVDPSSDLDIEALRLKRAKTEISVLDSNSRGSEFDAILEYRGRTLVLTRKKGDLNARWVVEG